MRQERKLKFVFYVFSDLSLRRGQLDRWTVNALLLTQLQSISVLKETDFENESPSGETQESNCLVSLGLNLKLSV